jgi:DNA-binding NarL/FixJ family response regulator
LAGGNGPTIADVSRVLIVDPSPFFGEALTTSLDQRGVKVVGWTSDERDAERLATKERVTLVLTELELVVGSGLSLARRLRDGPKTVVLTRLDPGDVLMDVAAVGAWGCVGHSTPVEALVAYILAAEEGVFAVDPIRLRETLHRAAVSRDEIAGGRLALLSPREREVLALVVRGFDNGAIARHLYLSRDTARTHVGRILRKLEVHSRAEAARLGLEAGIAPTGDMTRIVGPELSRK